LNIKHSVFNFREAEEFSQRTHESMMDIFWLLCQISTKRIVYVRVIVLYCKHIFLKGRSSNGIDSRRQTWLMYEKFNKK